MNISNEAYKYIAAKEQMKQRENDTRNAAILRTMATSDYGSPRNAAIRMFVISLITALIFLIIPFASADEAENNPEQTAFTQDAPGRQCDEYQVIVTTIRGTSGIDSDIIGFCSIGQAVNVVNRINAISFLKIKGNTVHRVAIPLF